jgi:hypothetical protein
MELVILLAVNPRYKSVIFIATTFVVMAPYLAFMLHCSFRFPQGSWPLWATNTMMAWFVANFLILMLVAKKMFRKQTTASGKLVTSTEQAGPIHSRIQTRTKYLLVLWSGGLVYGAIETIQGKISLSRAIPAGAFLLFFIALFGWALYQSRRRKTQRIDSGSLN